MISISSSISLFSFSLDDLSIGKSVSGKCQAEEAEVSVWVGEHPHRSRGMEDGDRGFSDG